MAAFPEPELAPLVGHPCPASHSPRTLTIEAVAHVPGTTQQLAVGYTHASGGPTTNVVGVILQSS
jgi:hypothetical protein